MALVVAATETEAATAEVGVLPPPWVWVALVVAVPGGRVDACPVEAAVLMVALKLVDPAMPVAAALPLAAVP
ncbi:MAG TPA: hypothetical protein VMW62_18080 [Chloroflexota bacterium]|nr:hypothetical protein [Chloroflexota bacterium]